MARELYVDFVGNSENRPVKGVTLTPGTNISVHTGSAGVNTFWGAESGAGTAPNVKTNAQGFFAVWLTEGRYDINIPHYQISKTISVINQTSVETGGGGIGEEAVTESKIAKEAVSTGKIAPEAVTKAKLAKAVQEEISTALAGRVEGVTQAATHVLTHSDAGKSQDCAKGSGEQKIEIPTAAEESSFVDGDVFLVTRVGAATLKIVPKAGVTVIPTKAEYLLPEVGGVVALRKRGGNSWVISGGYE